MQYTYEEVLDKIMSARRFGNLPGVEVTGRMLKALGLSGLSVPFIHVAGTNGKGSVCAFLRSIMQKAGVKAGCFVSPHLIDFRERITVDNVMIEKEDVTRLGNRLLSLSLDVQPTMFDYCLMLAVLYFKEQGCELAIVETGIGGRLDSTNALGRPLVSVITRIGYDHMAVLGDTPEAIASEKAGILKEGAAAVFAPQGASVKAVLLEAAERVRAKSAYMVTEEDMSRAEAYRPGLFGAYQYENAAVAAAAARLVLSGERQRAVSEGIRSARWPGRMQIVSEHPFFLVDGAHNSTGVLALRESLEKEYPGEKFRFVMGVMADKDYEAMADILVPAAKSVVTVTPPGERALGAKKLAETIRAKGVSAVSAPCGDILSLAKEGERTVALGSLYFIGFILGELQRPL